MRCEAGIVCSDKLLWYSLWKCESDVKVYTSVWDRTNPWSGLAIHLRSVLNGKLVLICLIGSLYPEILVMSLQFELYQIQFTMLCRPSCSRTSPSGICSMYVIGKITYVLYTEAALTLQVISTGSYQRIWPTYAVIGRLTKTLTGALLWLV